MKQYYTVFAQAYGEGSYGACTYNNSTSCTASSGSSSSGSSSGVLANTGFDILLVITLACALIFAALLVRMSRKNNRAKQVPIAEPIENDDDQSDSNLHQQ